MYEKTKHIRVQFYFIYELVKIKTITLVYIPRHVNTSDIFTKALDRTTFKRYTRGIGIFGITKGRLLKVLKESDWS